jgi:hypothetical protein
MAKRWLITLGAVVAWMFASLPPARAQTFDLDTGRLPITQIDSAWYFHLGDDPGGKLGWAQPGFDDSAWPTLKPTEDWTSQGYPVNTEFAWFRFHLRAPAHTQSLVLELPAIEKSYQLFSDGKLISQVGSLPPGPAHNVIGASRVFTLPVNSGDHPKEVAVALRVWQNPPTAGTRISAVAGPVFVGSPATVLNHFKAAKSADLLTVGSTYTIDIARLIVGVAALILFWLVRERFYFWYGATLLGDVCFFVCDGLAPRQAWDFSVYTYLEIVLDVLTSSFFALFIVDALFPARWKLAIAPICLTLAADLSISLVLAFDFSSSAAAILYCVFQASFSLILGWYLLRSLRSGSSYARLLLFPFTLDALNVLGNNAGELLLALNLRWGRNIIPSHYLLIEYPFTVRLEQAILLVELFGFLAVLVHRFAQTSREKQRLDAALKAAHDIQHRLVPVDIPTLGGLHTEIAYRAAEEVGGDFCQILPRPDGSIFVAIGDVSGKGLQAAMLGAVAVGALRSLADEDIEPAVALERLNNVLLRTENSGFITCLCLVLRADGEIRLANAGHLSPYLDGQEIPLEAGLPLGIVPGVTYAQSSFLLHATARLTLLSDGVVEARSATGELFGFERTTNVSRFSASEIAATAHKFGQEDDITVITLDWQTDALAGAPA